jgi:hypothetical protein
MLKVRRAVVALVFVVLAGLVAWGLMGGSLQEILGFLPAGVRPQGNGDRPPIIVADGSVMFYIDTIAGTSKGSFNDDRQGHIYHNQGNAPPLRLSVTVAHNNPGGNCPSTSFDTQEVTLIGATDDLKETDQYLVFISKKGFLTINTGRYNRHRSPFLVNTQLDLDDDTAASWWLYMLTADPLSGGAKIVCTFSKQDSIMRLVTIAQPSK